jgi:VCBS repeat-containing protein
MSYSFTQLNASSLNGTPTIGSDVNNSGQVVGYYFSGFAHAFLYSGGIYANIDDTTDGGVTFRALQIADYGAVLGLATVPDYYYVYNSGQFTVLSDPLANHSLAEFGTYPLNISAAGVVGYYSGTDGNTHGFLQAAGTYTAINVANASYTIPSAINDAGVIIGSYADTSGATHSFIRDTNGNITTFDDPTVGASSTTASYINNDGQIVGNYITSTATVQTRHWFLDDHGNFTDIIVPGSTNVFVNGISDAGVYGEYTDANGQVHGFIYKDGVSTTVDVQGNTLTNILSMSDSGEVLVVTENSSGTFYEIGTQAPLINPLAIDEPHSKVAALVSTATTNKASGSGLQDHVTGKLLLTDTTANATLLQPEVQLKSVVYDTFGASVDLTPDQIAWLENAFTATLTANPDRVNWSFQLHDKAIFNNGKGPDLGFLEVNSTLTLTFTVQITDTAEASTNQDVTVVVVGQSEDAVVGGASDLGSLAYTSSPAITDSLHVSAVSDSPSDPVSAANVGNPINGRYGSLVVNANGTYTYTADTSIPATLVKSNVDIYQDIFKYDITNASTTNGGPLTAESYLTVSVLPHLPTLANLALPSPLSAGFTVTQWYGQDDHGNVGPGNPAPWIDESLYYSIDLAANVGTKVLAQGHGIVLDSSKAANSDPLGFGNYVTIRYDSGLVATYMHLGQKGIPQVGSQVNESQTIGLIGTSGNETGAHLHITYGNFTMQLPGSTGIYADGSYLDNVGMPVSSIVSAIGTTALHDIHFFIA